MPLDLLPDTFICAPVSQPLKLQLGPCHGYARPGAPDRPLFSFVEAQRIAGNWKALATPGTGARYDARYSAQEEAFRFYDAEADAWHAWAGEDVGLATLYPIGEGAWRWDCGPSRPDEPPVETPSVETLSVAGAPTSSYHVFIVDDSEVICSLLAQYIATVPGLAVCGTATSGAEALAKLPGSGCDLAIVDVSMPGMSGIELVRRLRAEYPAMRSLVLSAHDQRAYVEAAINAGAGGYTTKEEPDTLIEAIWGVLRQGAYFSERASLSGGRQQGGASSL